MSIESLKAQARRHEQKEEWQKALDQYGLALEAFSDDDQPDIGLYNRIGDLYVRVGNYGKALAYYEKAVALYREATLYNNAIAVCKKIVRHVPARTQVFLTMGQIRAEQGFLPDARTNFLEYAERMQAEGNLDESFRALVEFCDLAPDDVDLRVTVAEQLAASGRTDEAVAQLGVAYRTFKRTDRDDRAFGLERRIMELAPDTDFDVLAAEAERQEALEDFAMGYGEVELPDEEGLEGEAAEEAAVPSADPEPETELEAEAEPVPEAEAEPEEVVGAGAWEEGDEGSDGEDGFDLPIMEGTSEWDDAEGAGDLPLIGFDEDEEEEEAPRAEPDVEPEPAAPVEPEPAAPAEREPVESASEYVDLGSMIFGDDPPEPRTTRFRVAYEEPSGDEIADFQKMLSQFKEKVSENLDAGDVRAHYDLGTAYKEMGLLDEAISEFQAALRASANHLPTYELMGQTFMEMGKHEAAVKSLERALRTRAAVEDDLVGIYYYLARAYEHLGKKDSAVEYYDRVFSLDINFADVTERLRALR